ncbi:MAG: NB-ARC domain-containing protein [Kineosporiaceae bacterium]
MALAIGILIDLVARGEWHWRFSLMVVVAAGALAVLLDWMRANLGAPPRGFQRPIKETTQDLVERPDEERQAVDAVLRRHARVVVISGESGFGKSTLAELVCASPRIRRHFKNIVWAPHIRDLADSSDSRAIASAIRDLLVDLGRDPSIQPLADDEVAGRVLARELEKAGRTLLVVDDVWTQSQLEPFLIGAPKCVRLITTRRRDLRLTPETTVRVVVGAMTLSQSHRLLLHDLSTERVNSIQENELVEELLQISWRWPFILQMINRILVENVCAGYALERVLRDVVDHIQVSGPAAADSLATDRPPGHLVAETLERGLELLDAPDARHRLIDLGIFPRQASIPLDVVLQLWARRSQRTTAEARSLALQMAKLSFFKLNDGNLRIHDIMHEHLGFLIGQFVEEVSVDLVEALSVDAPSEEALSPDTGLCTAWWKSDSARGYVSEYLLDHLIRADRIDAARQTATDLRWIVFRLRSSGVAAVLGDLERVGGDRASSLADTVSRLLHMLEAAPERPEAEQFLLNALRREPMWAMAATMTQGTSLVPHLVSAWPLPENPGPQLRRVFQAPSYGYWRSYLGVGALTRDASLLLLPSHSDVWLLSTASCTAVAVHHHGNKVQRVISSTTGRYYAALFGFKWVVYETVSGAQMSESTGDVWFYTLAFSCDDKSLVTTDNDGQLRLWAVDSGEEIAFGDAWDRRCVLPSTTAAFSEDGRWVVAAGDRGAAAIWDRTSGELIRRLRDPDVTSGFASSLVIAPDRAWIGVAGNDAIVRIWDSETAQLTARLHLGAKVKELAVSQDGARLAGLDAEGRISTWSAPTFKARKGFESHGSATAIYFAPDGDHLYSVGAGDARLWDLNRSKPAPDEDGMAAPTREMTADPCGGWVASIVAEGRIVVRDCDSGRLLRTLDWHERAHRLIVSPDGSRIAGETVGRIRVWECLGWTVESSFEIHVDTGAISELWFARVGNCLLALGELGVTAWDPRSGERLATMTTFSRKYHSLAVSVDRSWLAASDYYGTLWVWGWDGSLKWTLGGSYIGPYQYRTISAAVDGQLAATGWERGVTEIWDPSTGRLSSTVRGGQGNRAPVWSPDLKMYVAFRGDGSIVLERRETDRAEWLLLGGTGGVGTRNPETHVAFSPDGQWLAAQRGGDLALWRIPADDSEQAQSILQPDQEHGLGRGVRCLAIDDDAHTLVGGVWDGVVAIDLATGKQVYRIRHVGGHAFARIEGEDEDVQTYSIAPDAPVSDTVYAERVGEERSRVRFIKAFRGFMNRGRTPFSESFADLSPQEQRVTRRFSVQAVSTVSPDGGLGMATLDKIVAVQAETAVATLMTDGLGRALHAVESTDGNYVVVGAESSLSLWELSTGASKRVTLCDHSTRGLHMNENWVAAISNYGVSIYSMPDLVPLRDVVMPRSWTPSRVVAGSKGLFVTIEHYNRSVTIIDGASGEIHLMLEFTDEGGGSLVMAVSPDGEVLAAVTDHLFLVRISDGNEIARHPISRGAESLTWLPDNRGVLVGGRDGSYLFQVEGYR